jgi:hypothetical protein
MTKSMATTQNKFAEIEAAIRRQQQAIKQHQEELTNINDRTLTTLSLVHTTAGDALSQHYLLFKPQLATSCNSQRTPRDNSLNSETKSEEKLRQKQRLNKLGSKI